MADRRCARKGCWEVLCRRRSQEFGYLCNYCFSELLRSAPKSREDIAKFMATAPEVCQDSTVNLVFDEFEICG